MPRIPGPKPRPFFLRLLYFASLAFTMLLTILVVLTLLSRFGYFNLAGVSVVISHSMEPSIRHFDLVVYANTGYTVGDVIVYCLTPNHCVVHRVVEFTILDTVSGDKTMVVTKGDNANETDSPVEVKLVRGRVILVVPRELWIPLVLVLVAYSIYELSKLPVVGLSYTLMFVVGMTSMVAVYALTPQPIAPVPVKPLYVNLAGVYLDPATCTISVRYTGDLALTSVDITVNSTPVTIIAVFEKEVVFKLNLELLGEAFEHGKILVIRVSATLNHIGMLEGEYSLLVGGSNPEQSVDNGVLLVKNPNCFPVALNVSMRYLKDSTWYWSNQSYRVNGFSYLAIEPPEDAEVAYVYIYWYNQGEERWTGLPLKTRR